MFESWNIIQKSRFTLQMPKKKIISRVNRHFRMIFLEYFLDDQTLCESLIQLFEMQIWLPRFLRIRERQGGIPKIDQDLQLLFCPKRDLTGTQAIFRTIFLNIPKKIEIVFTHVFGILWRGESYILIFFLNTRFQSFFDVLSAWAKTRQESANGVTLPIYSWKHIEE